MRLPTEAKERFQTNPAQFIEEEIKELQASDLFLLKTKVEKAEAEGADVLAEMALQASARIDEARRAYERVTREAT